MFPACTAWEYVPMAAGASAVAMDLFMSGILLAGGHDQARFHAERRVFPRLFRFAAAGERPTWTRASMCAGMPASSSRVFGSSGVGKIVEYAHLQLEPP